jgi:hypothetical protein
VRFAAHETAAENDVGLAFDDREEQLGVVCRVILKVGVLYKDDVAGGELEAVAEGRAFALVDGLVDDLEIDASITRRTSSWIVPASL